MAKQKSFIKFKGTLGGLNFYFLNGEPIVRRAGGGFTGHAIKKKKNMARVRENGKEFGYSSSFNKKFRGALKPLHMGYRIPGLHNRLMRVFQIIKKLDTTASRGERHPASAIGTPQGIKLLKDFEYTPGFTVSNVYPFKVLASENPGSYVLQALDTPKFPKGATHADLVAGIVHFNSETQTFSTYRYPKLSVTEASWPETVALEPTGAAEVPETGWLVLSIQYYMIQNEVGYRLRGASGIGLGVLHTY